MSIQVFFLNVLISLCNIGEFIVAHPFISAGVVAGFIYGTKQILKEKTKKEVKTK